MTLIIRREQLAAFQRLKDGPLAEVLCRQLRSAHAEAVASLDDPALRRAVDSTLEEGRRFGLRGSHALVSFVTMTLTLGRGFAHHPQVARWLVGDLEQAMESLPLRLAPGEIEVIAGDLRRASA